jgi:hypothetical protein
MPSDAGEALAEEFDVEVSLPAAEREKTEQLMEGL